MNKSLKLMLKMITFAMGFLIIDFTAWYLILNNYGVSLYRGMLGGLIILSFIISLVFIAILMSYMKKINSLKYRK
jgi:hypothetical protein